MRQSLVSDGPSDATTGGRIVIADDQPSNLALLERLLAADHHVVYHAASGDDALELIARENPDLVLLDVMMPGRNGIEVCRIVKARDDTRLIPVVLVTALHESEARLRGIEAGADDFISKPFNPPELRARIRSLLRLKRYTDELGSAEDVILSLALTIEARDPYTDGHCQRLAAYAWALGEALRLDARDLAALDRGAALHDVGKVGVPDAVLLKTGPLTPEEVAIMKQHTVIGDRLCRPLRALQRVRPIVRHHHERLDGSGYPDGLQGDAIPLLAQIIGIVDVFDAITTARPYKPAGTLEDAARELRFEVGRGWRRADLVETFLGIANARGWPARAAAVAP